MPSAGNAALSANGDWFAWALNGGSPQWPDEFRAIFA